MFHVLYIEHVVRVLFFDEKVRGSFFTVGKMLLVGYLDLITKFLYGFFRLEPIFSSVSVFLNLDIKTQCLVDLIKNTLLEIY